MNRAINIGIIGAGGYASTHIRTILEENAICRLAAAVLRTSDRHECLDMEEKLKKEGTRIYRDYRDMLASEKGKIDLVVVPTSIDQHSSHSIESLNEGYHVLCEKPLTGSADEIKDMRKAMHDSGKVCAVGYQNIFSPSIQKIKEARCSGIYGDLLGAKTWVCWPRSSAYYTRNTWAGKIRNNGRTIYDSPVQNAVAHFLQNMMYIAGETPDATAFPARVTGENYRCKDIESSDTQCLRIYTENDIELYFSASHAVTESIGPVTEYHFEKARIVWNMGGATEVFKKENGEKRIVDRYDNGNTDISRLIYRNVIDAIISGKKPYSHFDNTFQHVYAVIHSFSSSGGVVAVDPAYTQSLRSEKEDYEGLKVSEGTVNIIIPGIEKAMQEMWKNRKMFFEYGFPWAEKPSEIIVKE